MNWSPPSWSILLERSRSLLSHSDCVNRFIDSVHVFIDLNFGVC
jgi:hypothetical protein